MATTSAVDVVMPQMGVSVSEGTITKWLKQEGEEVQADEPLLEISTDKVDTEVPSPGSGVVTQILVQEGETVEVGTKLAVIGGEAGGAQADAPQEAPPPEPATQEAAAEAAASSGAESVAPAPAQPQPQPEPEPEQAPAPEPAPAAQAGNGQQADGKSFVSPVVARIASEHGIDPTQVPGTGRGGRVTKKDILNFVESGSPAQAPASEAPAPAPAPAPTAPAQPQPVPAAAAPAAPLQAATPTEAAADEVLEPMNAMRRGIADHMRRSLDTAAHVTSAIEVDMSRVVAIREKLKPEYQKSYGVNPTYLIFVARAVVETLKNYPWINGEIRGEQIVTRQHINLGFAVELADGKGLIVPVVKHAEGLNLLGMAQAVTDIAERARNKQLRPDEVQGGTFTITNPGGYGTFHGTPIISQPQSGIRPIMNITLTYDHRLVDGALAGRFLQELRKNLETWDEVSY
jgi:pyruvate dehydrogenase E2 component (dihydrolipoamide acetyltransferase)